MDSFDAGFAEMLQPYAAAVPADFHRELFERLPLPQRRPRRVGLLVPLAAMAAAVFVVSWITLRIPHQQTWTTPSQPVARENRPMPKPPGVMLGMLTLDAQMSRAPLIVRTRVTKTSGWNIEFTLLRTIFGHTENKTFTFDITYGNATLAKSAEDQAREQFVKANGRDPTAEELHTAALLQHGIAMDREVILMLEPGAKAGEYRSLGMQFDAPPGHPLDGAEKEMMRVIEAGSYLDPVSFTGDVFGPQVASASAIVRAKLLEVTKTEARWQVTRTLKGKVETTDVLIDHDQFHQRAESLINYAARDDESLRADPKRATAIQAKMEELINRELVVGKEADLFLGELKKDGTVTRAPVQHLRYGDADGKNLEQLEDAVVGVEKIPTRL